MLGNNEQVIRRCNRQHDRGQLFGLFDGMGSLEQGGRSARFMGDQLREYFLSEDLDYPAALRRILRLGNDEINCWPPSENSRYTASGGCAGTVALCIDGRVHVFHAGDTTALLLGADYDTEGDHLQLTTCHNTRVGLVSFWGIGERLVVDETIHPFEEDDILFLASDGLTDVMDNGEIAHRIRNGYYFTAKECAATCRSLCELARRRGSGDDITALIVYREE
jgi:serine/threonine protein phosphatase PrpC